MKDQVDIVFKKKKEKQIRKTLANGSVAYLNRRAKD